MRNALKNVIVTSLLVTSMAGAPSLFAATQNHSSTAQPEHMRKMMQGKGSGADDMGMMNNGDTMPMMKMMAEMNRMMSNCNQMMQQKMDKSHMRQRKASGKS